MGVVRFSKKWFNPLYFIINEYINDDSVRTILVYGGKSSAKTHSLCQIFSKQSALYGDSTLSFRKYSTDIPTTLKETYAKAVNLMFLGPAFEKQDRRYLSRNNDSKIILRGLDDEEKAKGTEGFKFVHLEELNQFSYEEYTQFEMSLRGMAGQKMFGTWNPVSENSWVKTKLIDTYKFIPTKHKLPSPSSFVHISECGKVVLIKTTYEDNYWVSGSPCNTYGYRDENLIGVYDRLKEYDYDAYRVNVLGEWGVENKESKFVWAFSKSHIKETTHDPERITWATFDFNVNPLTCTVAQVFPDMKIIRAIECIKLQDSDIWKMCERIQSLYPGALWNVTGDATGQSRSALVRDNTTYYQIIQQQLKLLNSQIKVPTVNPPVEENRILVNAVHKNWTVEIHPTKCQPLIYDLTYVEVNGKGEIIKDRSSSKKFADFLDNWRYLLNTAVKPHFNLR